MWRITAKILNKHPWTADKGWSSSVEVGREANNLSSYNIKIFRNVTQDFGLATKMAMTF
jgi:hypothetical protein